MPDWRIFPVADDDSATIDEVRELFREYHAWLGAVVCSHRLAEEIVSLPGPYAAPKGRLFVARDRDGGAVGCVGVRPHEGASAEIKRLYVRPEWRGTGLGRALAETALTAVGELGYDEALITTLPNAMQVAAALYERMGFEQTEPFIDHRAAGEDVQMLYLRKRV